MMLVWLSVLHLLIGVLAIVPIIGWVLGIAMLGYIYATFFKLIYTTGVGYSEAPEFPDFGDAFESMLIPLLKMAIVHLFAYLPYLIFLYQSGGEQPFIELALVLLANCYLPMGLMVIAMDDFTEAFNPVTVIQGIRSAGLVYWLTTIALFGAFTISELLQSAFAGSWILAAAIGSYFIMFKGRLIGSVYRERIETPHLVVEKEAEETL
ncbi:MAG: hypothetical protein ACPGJU_10360 [Coraliomargarita sp.]